MRKLLSSGALLFVLSLNLTGCAIAFHAANGTLSQVFPGLSGSKSTASTGPTTVELGPLGDGTGYQPATMDVVIPANVCDHKAFMEGFKDDFIVNWNQSMQKQIHLFQSKLNHQHHDKASAANLALYKSHLIGAKGYANNNAKYFSLAGKSLEENHCPSDSYTEGKNAGLAAVSQERQTLANQEI